MSYNRWLVRYLYIPLGGARRRLLNMWPTFIFVAMWHDLDPKLLGWAVISCTFAIPETLCKAVARSERLLMWRDTWQYRMACGLAATANIIVLMVANLIGFVVGTSGIRDFLGDIFNADGGMFTASMITATFFCAAQVMFMIRESEANERIATINKELHNN